jgi:hypothetical protein
MIDALLNIGGKLVDKLIPDPKAQAEAKLSLAKMAQEGELAKLANESKLYEVEQNNLSQRHTAAYVELLGQWGMLIMSFYFGGRTLEKIIDLRKPKQ